MIIARVQNPQNQERSYGYKGYKIRYTQSYWKEIPDELMAKMKADIASGFLITEEVNIEKGKLKKDEVPVCLDSKLQKHFPVKFFEIPKIVKTREVIIEPIAKKEPKPEEPKKPGRPPKVEKEKESVKDTGESKGFDPAEAIKKKKS
jgi:hypothetical protein